MPEPLSEAQAKSPQTAEQAPSREQPVTPVAVKGLDGVVALDTEIAYIDGANGVLLYRGYDIRDLAENTTFEETAYLLWNGKLPNRQELDELNAQLVAARPIPEEIVKLLRFTPKDTVAMHVLRTAVSALALYDEEAEDMSHEANYRKSVRLTAQIPTIIAAFDRIRKGKEPVAPLDHGSTAFNFLYMLNGEEPGPSAERTFDAALVMHAEHGLAASCFTARVIGSTLSDLYSAVTGALGALKGPLHGGANMGVMRMLIEIDESGQDPEAWVRERLEKKEKVMGFGHRVYKVLDPRAVILREMVEDLSEETDQRKWYDLSVKIMKFMEREKKIYANVDYFSASVYYMLGIDIDLYTPIFGLARITGWTAHMLEQWKENRLIRPRAAYIGPRDLKVKPIDERK